MEGHAGFADDGEPDIICAAATALSTGTIGSIQDVLHLNPIYLAEEGHISCRLDMNDLTQRQCEDVDLLYRSLETALRQIEISYGAEFLKVRRKLVN